MTHSYACPVCDSAISIELDSRRDIPIGQNLVFRDQGEAKTCAVGQLQMRRCLCCAFVWNADFEPALMRYDVTYDNEQNLSDVFRRHVDQVADRVLEAAPRDRPTSVLEVGCGQGTFLAILSDKLGSQLEHAIGYDPAWRGDRSKLPDGIEIVGEYFSSESSAELTRAPDVVVSRHTIEHVSDPISFLKAIKAVTKPGAAVLIETPTVDWILETGTFFDFFYEHCSIFNPDSITYALRKVGFEVREVELLFGGQYLLAKATVPLSAATGEEAICVQAASYSGDLGYVRKRNAQIAALRSLINSFQDEKIALWGGASKGVTVALVLEQERDRIYCAIDINPKKQGGFMPGSGIPILSPEAAKDAGVSAAIVMNPNYEEEIRIFCQKTELKIDIKSI